MFEPSVNDHVMNVHSNGQYYHRVKASVQLEATDGVYQAAHSTCLFRLVEPSLATSYC